MIEKQVYFGNLKIFSYQKFTRAKDMTNYSESDKIAVLGLKKAKIEEEKEESPKVEEEEKEKEITVF